MFINKQLLNWLSLATLLLTTACSPVKTLNAIIPDSGYTLTRSLAYGSLPRQTLDVYVPRQGDQAANRPVVVFFYGGSWDSGARGDYKFVAEALTSQGFVVVIPDYRVYPQVLFPDFLYDAAAAVKWTTTHISEYGGDNRHVFLAGHSAGAHIAVMLALDKQYLASVNLSEKNLSGVIGLAGPYDFLPLKSERLKVIFGGKDKREDLFWKSQPINFVHGDNPPMLLLVGLKDDTVWPRNSYNLAVKIIQAGGEASVVEFPSNGHIDMVAKLAKPLRDEKLLASMSDFIRAHAQ